MHQQMLHSARYKQCAPRVRRCTTSGRRLSVRCFAGSNGTKPPCPTAAETARTVVHLSNEGTLSAVDSAGLPIGIPVSYTLDERGQPIVHNKEVQRVPGEEFCKAEPDVLRKAVPDFVQTWNSDRAEDIYRIVASFLGVTLAEMQYAELLWLDRLGMYVKAEATGMSMSIIRVPFYRQVLDERDARSVITMAAQLAWERERNYVPVLPSSMAEAAANN